MVVGTKIDLRNDPKELKTLEENGETPYTKEDGEKLAKELNAYCYMECSALTRKGLNEIFEQAIRYTLSERSDRNTDGSKKSGKNRKCTIL